ncbi:MAG: single-stranded DNA-binding protein [Endomicrobium sp.]|jgi:single-strand DNA-binding protein|nr:single-stranded DNA-binding protein [Endomicrobium sp.]
MNQQPNNSLRLPEQNSVIVMGRLTKDPELRRTGTGKAVCSFDVAISRRMKDITTGQWKDADPTFVPIIVWGDQAERCNERLKKGYPVYIEGRLQTNKWEGSDGTKKSRLEVVVSRIQFLFVVKQDSMATVWPKSPDDNVLNESQDIRNDEDVPF